MTFPRSADEGNIKAKAHEDLFSLRFVKWQVEFGLLSNDSRRWSSSWKQYEETYRCLVFSRSAVCKSFLSFDSGCVSTEVCDSTHQRIRCDVLRLSRYFSLFGSCLENNLRRLERILYIFSICSSASGYQQGFHELLFPFFFVGFDEGRRVGFSDDLIESVVYFLFHSLMNGTIFGDFYIDSSTRMKELFEDAVKVLGRCDKELSCAFAANGIDLVLCTFSWMNVLFTQVYNLESILTLWDFIFCHLSRLQETICDLIACHLMLLRDRLLGKSFAQMMKVFHNLEMRSEGEAIKFCEGLMRGGARGRFARLRLVFS